MALVTDPDSLSQGTLTNVADLAFTASADPATTITGAATLPALADNEWIEIRNANTPANDGLYRVNDASPTTSSVTLEKFTGGTVVNDTAASTDVLGTTGASTEKSVHFDTDGLKIYLFEQGNLSADGTTMLALHSFMKEEWKATDNYLISRADFPMVGISFAAGQWQIGTDPSGNFSGWNFADDITAETQVTRDLIRNAGWDALDANGNIIEKYFNVTTLPTSGAFEDTLDQAWYWFGTDNTDTAAAVDYAYTGEVNEPVRYFLEGAADAVTGYAITTSNTIARNDGGDWAADGYQVGGQITIRAAEDVGNNGSFVLTSVGSGVDGSVVVSGTPLTNNAADTTMVPAVDNSNAFTTALRIRDADPEGKTYGEADLAAGGETEITSKIIKLGLGNATDLKITDTDANVSTISPYTEVRLRYLEGAYQKGVDSATLRDFGIVVDAGTHSDITGISAGTTTFTTSATFVLGVGEALADYTGGTLTLHNATAPDRATHTIVGTPTAPGGVLTVVLSSALTNSETDLSFTMNRATPLSVSYLDIFEKIQYQLRQATDINENKTTAVIGKTAGRLGTFEGDTLRMGSFIPTNPVGGGSGVIIEGFDTNNTNSLSFVDNSAVQRTFPFVAAGTLVFNQGLVDDTDGEYWLYYEYTVRTNLTDGATVGPSGDTYDLESPGSNLPALLVDDYILVSGFAQDANNGLFIVTAVNVSTQDYTVRKLDGSAVGTAESGQTIDVDEHPYPGGDAIIVDNNAGAPIAGSIGATSISFDYDYDNNVQGGRTASTDANVVLVAMGLETGQAAVVSGLTITQATGLTFSLTSALERNYSNP